jgi:hypothetical protein
MDNYETIKEKKRVEKANDKKLLTTSETVINGLYE